jgi:hypothetical protein
VFCWQKVQNGLALVTVGAEMVTRFEAPAPVNDPLPLQLPKVELNTPDRELPLTVPIKLPDVPLSGMESRVA